MRLNLKLSGLTVSGGSTRLNPSTQEAEAGDTDEFEASLVYNFNSRTAKAVQRNPGPLGTIFAEDLCVSSVGEREKRASQSAIFQHGTPMAVFSGTLLWN